MSVQLNPLNNRSVQDGDWSARQFFFADDLAMSPEEYAARNAHNWGCFSFHLYHYQDVALGNWVRRLAEILFDPDEVDRCRNRYLTPEELAEVRRRMEEPF